MTAAEKGQLGVVAELLKYSNKASISRKNRSGFDAFHVAVKGGHQGESLYLSPTQSTCLPPLYYLRAQPRASLSKLGHCILISFAHVTSQIFDFMCPFTS